MIYNLYDWDDTLVYSRQALYKAYAEAINVVLNKSMTWDVYNKRFYGNSNIFLASLGCDDLKIKKIRDLKNYLYEKKYYKYIKKLITDFSDEQKHVIVSNTTVSTIRRLIDLLEFDCQFFEIIGSDSYYGANRKPAPDLYHYALSKLSDFDYDSDEVIIYEDSYQGALSALTFFEQVNIPNVKLIYHPPSWSRISDELSKDGYINYFSLDEK